MTLSVMTSVQRALFVVAMAGSAVAALGAQRPVLGAAVKPFIRYDSTITVRSLAAARAVASSPSGCAMR